MELSNRLSRISDMIPHNKVIADIGTDHGQLPVFLVTKGQCPKAYAVDISKMSLSKAEGLVSSRGLANQIICRVSDGFDALVEEAIEVGIMAGMGGMLMASIIERPLPATLEHLVLSPQSDVDLVRRKLHDIGFRIDKEEMVEDEGKYYTVILATRTGDVISPYSALGYKYGQCLIDIKHPVLKDYLEKKLHKVMKLAKHLTLQVGECASARQNEVDCEIREIKEVLSWLIP